MADDDRNPLELDAVVRRFAESADALTNVREQLQVLNELRETEEKANASLQDSAGQVARFVAEAASILRGLEDAQIKVAEVLRRGADMLDGTELKGIGETVRGNAESIAAVGSRVDALDSKVTELKAMEETVKRNAESIATVGSRVDSVNSKVTELKGIEETVRGNAESISAVSGRIGALDSRLTELVSLVDSLRSTLGQDIDNLNAQLDDVHADVKAPIIVKRFF